jgi:hypothetical protein
MAIRAVIRPEDELESAVQRLMAERGLSRRAAELVVAIDYGYAMVGDREEIPDDKRDAVLAEERSAAEAYLRGRSSPS